MSEVTIQLEKLLDNYSEEVKEVAKEVIKEFAQQTADRLKNTSPQRTGKYAKGWKVKTQGDSATVYNTQYQLTHLLENSHVIRNKYGEYGRTNPKPHIAPAEEWAEQELLAELERRLS